MSFEQVSPGSATPFLPSHRFYPTTSTKASPVYAIPARYLKRRGVLLFLVCITSIAVLHYLYFVTSEQRLGARPDSDDGMGLPDYTTVGQIWEEPWAGPAPINGVDGDGFEIVEESFASKDDPGWNTGSTGNDEGTTKQTPKTQRPIQFNFRDTLAQTGARTDLNKQRLTVIRNMIQHAWTGYLNYAAPHDELSPLTMDSVDMFHGWGATLVESMDTLLLANMTEEYRAAKMMFLDRLKQHQWNQADDAESKEQVAVDNDSINFSDGVVRYIGGLLSAAELEEVLDPEALQAAVSLGDRLVQVFQGSKNALPGNRIFDNGTVGSNEALFGKVSLAEVCTFQLEFRKLSQLSNNTTYMALAQENFSYLASFKPRIAGLYPAYFDPEAGASQDYIASFGSLSYGFYEYLLKTFILTGDVKFRDLYISTIEAMHGHLISRPHKKSEPYLVLGVYYTATESLVPKMDHLSCSAPGLLALGARVLGRTKDLVAARGLMETCYLSYKNSVTGLGADEIAFLESEYMKGREFEMPQPSGFYVINPEYNLQPETVESLFIMYRITGDKKYQDYAWEIAQAIEKNCRTKAGYSALANVMDASEGMIDRMPSHFLAQTLKYLYLIFSSPDLASLDDFIFSTGGHLMKYPIV